MTNKLTKRPTRGAVNDVEVVHGSGNVFADIGLPNPELLLVKSAMVYRITAILSARRLRQREAARILGIDQPGVSDLIRGHLSRFSTDRLIRFLNALGHDVEVVITKRAPSSRRPGQLRVRNAVAPIAAAAARIRPRAAATARKAGRAESSTTRAQAGGRQG